MTLGKATFERGLRARLKACIKEIFLSSCIATQFDVPKLPAKEAKPAFFCQLTTPQQQ